MDNTTLEEKVRALETPSLPRWLLAALIDWLWIIAVLTISIYFNNFFLYVIAVAIIGIKRHALTLLGHDGTHFLITKNKTLNDLMAGFFVFWPSFVGVMGYRIFHIPHHMFLGSQKDPELFHKKDTSPEWDLPMTKKGILRRTLLDMIGGGIKEVLTIFKYIGFPHKAIDVIGPLLWWGIVTTILYSYGGIALPIKVFLLWNIAMLTSFITVFRLRMMSEHLGSAGVYRIKATWWQAFIFLPHNTWYHYEHHSHFRVPHFNLPKLRDMDLETPIETISEVFKRHTTSPSVLSGVPLRHIEE